MMKKITTNGTIKSLARQMFGGHFFEGFLLVVMVEVLTSVPALLINFFAPDSVWLAWLNDIYVILVKGPLNFGLAIYFLCNFREQRVGLNAVAHGFEFFGKSVSLFIAILFKVIVGLIVFVIPGIIAFLNCSQALYILVDDPSKSVSECIAESKEMMRGNKLNLVSFYLSYAGWFVIAMIPSFILARRFTDMSTAALSDPQYIIEASSAMAVNPWNIVCEGILLLAVTYLYMGKAGFYDIYSGNLIFEAPAESTDVQEI